MNHTLENRLSIDGLLVPMVLAIVLLAWPLAARAEQDGEDTRTQAGEVFVCDDMASGRPLGRAIVFPSAQGTVYCYSDFVRVAGSEQITHHWFFRDREVAQYKLTLQPPRWSTYSSMKVPVDGKGPWRVEVLDQDGVVYGTARFSIVE